MDTTRVLVLFGGRSDEHSVSCLSARSVLGVLDRDRHDVLPVGITRDGRWQLTDGPPAPGPDGDLPVVGDEGDTVGLVRRRDGPSLIRLDGDDHEDLGPVDVCFPVLHGPYGEDGTVQGLLASVGVPYVGADVTASSIGIDKRAAKAAFAARGLPQGAYRPVRRRRFEADPEQVLDDLEAALRRPVFTKPARQGSSIGITKCHDRDDLRAGIEQALTHDRVVVVEEAVEDARELEVGVLGNDTVTVTGPGEIVPSHEFYDFEAKYLDESELLVPADVPDDLVDQIATLARRAYLAIGCRGMARVDFFLDAGGSVLVNEINTIPGFTERSMFPLLWEAEGLAYPELVERLLGHAVEAAVDEANYAP